MATSTFRSTMRRAGDAGSSTRGGGGGGGGGGALQHRRSRSLSRGPARFPPATPPSESGEFATPRGRFVNKVRGAGFPEISLDDLADEFFRARAESEGEDDEEAAKVGGRSGRRLSGARYAMETESSQRRGRSVSRPRPDRKGSAMANGNGNVSNGGLRRQRYSSVDRHGRWDSENDMDVAQGYNTKTTLRKSSNGNVRQTLLHKPTKEEHTMRRSMSQKDFLLSHDSSSSHSSLTDDEARDLRSTQSRNEKTIQTVYAQAKDHPVGDDDGTGLYEAMRKEVRHAVDEIRTELEKVMAKADPKGIVNNDIQSTQVISELRRDYSSKLEESEKRKQELLAELAAEEQRGQELTKIVKELLPSSQKATTPERQSRTRRRSNDRTRVSKHLIEEAERYFEDFLSNVEDTDISSFDGERSDASSTRRDVAIHTIVPEVHVDATKVTSSPAETDGVVLPWLQWETSNDISLSPCKTNSETAKGESSAYGDCNHLASSRGSWSPETNNSSAVSKDKVRSTFGEVGSRSISISSLGHIKGSSSFNMDEYLHLKSSEDFLFEVLKQRQRTDSGSLILCGRTLF
ncbi:zinc finger C3H1 domain-containing protein-like [Ananas comosus]|uniref:Zinc finger C3H1 domain-containing protein-like n=1 Tax=Ananas comosus TaxID=4615 RepID=A0A6P5GN87_ANACO|nr:zinc finger C3H1 domain-containing protein-like [Ananas comosus]